MFYFSYGSNMDKNQMLERKCIFHKSYRAILKDYKLVFNKKSEKIPQITFANIEASKGDIVEGVLYEIDDIKYLDKYEGYPTHYDRIEIELESNDKKIKAWVYIAQDEWITNLGKPSKEYMYHLLEGREYLSAYYYSKIENYIVL